MAATLRVMDHGRLRTHHRLVTRQHQPPAKVNVFIVQEVPLIKPPNFLKTVDGNTMHIPPTQSGKIIASANA